jgi:hypothetical protein
MGKEEEREEEEGFDRRWGKRSGAFIRAIGDIRG